MNGSLFRHRKRSSGGVVPFTPLSIPDCVLWLDANDLTSMPNNPLINEWDDKSGLNHDALIIGAWGFTPTIDAWSLNANNCLLFNPINQGMLLIDYFADLVNPEYTCFTLIENLQVPLDGDGIAPFQCTPTSCQMSHAYYNAPPDVLYATTCDVINEWNLPFPTPQYLQATTRVLTPDFYARINGSDLGNGNSVVQLDVGTKFILGGYYEPDGFFANHRLAEVVAYSRSLSAPEVLQVENYLRVKWTLP
jgi:hypothetical protein